MLKKSRASNNKKLPEIFSPDELLDRIVLLEKVQKSIVLGALRSAYT